MVLSDIDRLYSRLAEKEEKVGVYETRTPDDPSRNRRSPPFFDEPPFLSASAGGTSIALWAYDNAGTRVAGPVV